MTATSEGGEPEMFEGIKQKYKENWEEFKDAQPGHRFQDRYERRHQDAKDEGSNGKIFTIGLGLIVAILGLVMIPAPGPGAIIMFLGLSLVGSEFLPLAKFMDNAELRVRPTVEKAQSIWQHTSLAAKSAVGFLALACAAGMAYGAYHYFDLGTHFS